MIERDMAASSLVYAVIPARAGSKGIPGKNIMSIAGRPLLAYSILQAKASAHICRVIVSTDGEDIADAAREWGAEVPFMRPPEFAGDLSPDIDTFRHCLEWLQQYEGRLPDIVVHLRPTGPVRRVSLIDQAITTILDVPGASSLRSVSLAEQSPYKMWSIENDRLVPILRLKGRPEAHSMARQSLPRAYWQNGYVDIIRPETILEKNSMVGDSPLPFIIEEPKYELDYPEDIPAVEQALLRLAKRGTETGAVVTDLKNRFPV